MTAPTAKSAKRLLRNYLLDPRFQLKFTLYTVTATAVVAGVLGATLWSTSQRLISEAQLAVDARSAAAETSKELGAATLNNELFKHFDDPGFQQSLREQSKKLDAVYERERAGIVTQHQELVRQQRHMALALVAAFLALLLIIATFSIIATHKVVGPVYRLKRMMQTAATGQAPGPTRLRRGDELQDLFEEFLKLIERLQEQHAALLAHVEAAQRKAQAGAGSQELLAELAALRQVLESFEPAGGGLAKPQPPPNP